MALNFYELKDSGGVTRTADSIKLPRKFIAFYSDSRSDVYSAAVALLPLTDAGYFRQDIDIQPIGAGFWNVIFNYGFSVNKATDEEDTPEEPGDPVGPETSFDCSAGEAHITQSLKTLYRWADTDFRSRGTSITVDATNNLKVTPTITAGPAVGALDVGKTLLIPRDEANGFVGGQYTVTAQGGGQWTLNASPAAVGKTTGFWTLVDLVTTGKGTGPDYKQAIGVTTDRVEGCSISVPKFEFSYTVQSLISKAYLATLRKCAGRTNAKPWWWWDAGEVLYLGASGSCGPDKIFKVTHKFAVGENLKAVPVSPEIVVPQKNAFDFLWCVYKPGANAGAVVQTPKAAFVEQVYQSVDFAANLGF